MLVYLLLLAAVVALGYFTDIVDFTELKAVFSLKLTALLKLAVMVLLVLLVSNLVIFILHGIKPRTHRGGSVLSLLSSLVKYVAGIIIVCQSLSLLGVNVGTIIASVGVLALVVGFSAESLIADVVIGAFMLLENQYNVGDIVEVNGFRGVVTKIGIRTTSITDGGGNVKIINNSEMKNILNRSDNNSWSVSDISIPYETDLEKLEAQLPALLEAAAAMTASVPVQAGDELSEYGLDDAKTSLTVTADGETLTFTRGDQAASGDWYLYCTEDGTVRMVSDDTVKVFQLLDGSIYDLALLPTLPAVTMDTLHAVSITGADGVRIDLRVTDGVRKAGSRDVTAETEALMDELSGLAVTACVDYDPAEGAAAICGLDAPAAALTLTYANAVGAEETLTVTVGLPIGDGGRYVALDGDTTIYRMEESSLTQILTLSETGL